MPKATTQAMEVLRLLQSTHNVLVAGAPSTGKTVVLSEVARLFVQGIAGASAPGTKGPVHVPGARVAVPAVPPTPPPPGWQPSPSRAKRMVFRTVFHQASKYRDFVSGIVPEVSASGAGTRFRVTTGKLIEAADHALKPDGASLLIIDEINRGPAVQLFGGSIVAIESDKRLDASGAPHATTQTFDVLQPNGSIAEYALPHHLYILAAMNEADTSVEAMDVAFLRRWTKYRLAPDAEVLGTHIGIDPRAGGPLPPSPLTPDDVFRAAARAWEKVNGRIRLGRGPEYQIGHGVFMTAPRPTAGGIPEALAFVRPAWDLIRAHVDEVFFGDIRGVAEVLGARSGRVDHVIQLRDHVFADEPRLALEGPDPIPDADLYRFLRAVAE